MSNFEKFAVSERMLSVEESKKIKGGVIVGYECVCRVSGLWFSVPASGFSNDLVAEICNGTGAGCSPVEV